MSQSEFTLLGDALWLDFVNTARGRTPLPPDRLADEAAMERWAQTQRLLTNGDAFPLLEVLRLRDRLTLLAEALQGGLQPPAGSIAAINEQLARGDGRHQLTRVGGEWQLRFAPMRRPGVLEAIAQSAASSLADPLRFVRRCAGDGCSLFFADDSPNQSRRWCSATVCGREVKVERRRGLLR
ncbi:MAG TPA: CGNR zinc finger domain-containing protein [Gemmatimonadales bacterium]|jgi:predicted RNA-binding Zn ribbon-like protein|nr:CGNR zinc finger domain-containing protein [Gemmatimonadales bacterium]